MDTTLKQPPPTLEQFQAYQSAWAYFNTALFDGDLAPCLLNFSRHRGSNGFFTANRWQRGDQKIHEISLNPDQLLRPAQESMGTLVHEMVHQWQQDHGEPPRKSYHDAEWANKMEEVGLIPSDTGEPGGHRTGQRMSHYVEPGGKFDLAFRRMPREALLPWQSGCNAEPTPSPRAKKVKLKCPECGMAIWTLATDAGRDVECGDCGERFLNKDELKERKDEDHD